MSFQDWCDWAREQSDESKWPHVADIAAADAKYDDDDHRDDFQEAIGEKHPRDERTYKEICWSYPLKGAPVAGTPSEYLTRCKEIETLRSFNRDLVQRTGDLDRRNHPSQYQFSGLSGSDWQSVDEALDLVPEYQNDDFYAAYSTGTPAEKCVFATAAERGRRGSSFRRPRAPVLPNDSIGSASGRDGGRLRRLSSRSRDSWCRPG